MPRRLLIALLVPLLLGMAGCVRPLPDVPYPDPARYEIRGVDISAHNGEVDFGKLKAQGFEFAYIKATEGATFRDRRFIHNINNARAAGLKVGAYHFFRFDMPGYMQGLNLASAVEGRQLDLPVVIDLEEWTNPNAQATPLVMERLIEMIEHLESRGMEVMIYTNKNGYARFISQLPRTMPLWICSLGAEPDSDDWTLWQATHSGKVNGADTPVDINVFRGSRSEWQSFLGQ
ncbi:MAG: hypothetical protein NC339_08815 [Muribaculaceae bacterium]|nr:hypothetical protein [Muribaculaceae bacterium]